VLNPKIQRLRDKPVWPAPLQRLPSSKVVDYVTGTVGSRPWQRDPIDQRIVDSVLKRGGRIIDSQDEVGGYPSYGPTHRKLETIPEGAEARRQWLDRLEGTDR
jgi:hypothetical protein